MPAEIAIPPLAPDEIHVWTVSPVAIADEAEALVSVLSTHEQHRAARMRQPDDRLEFIVGRARVRQLLGAYVRQPGHLLDVVTRVDDKPMLAGAPAWFDFSFSRCPGVHVCAVGAGRRIGVDVALHGDGGDAEAIARVYFSPDEAAWLATLTPPDHAAAFAALWAKKEAFVKAVGSGLTLPLTAFNVPLQGDGAVHLPAEAWPVSAASGTPRRGDYLVRAFTPAPGVAGAVAAEGEWRMTPLRYPA